MNDIDPRRLLSRADEVAGALRLLGNSRRLVLIWLLRDGEKSVGDLARTLHISQSVVSQHLTLLRQANIVEQRRAGTTVFYKLDLQQISPILQIVLASDAG